MMSAVIYARLFVFAALSLGCRGNYSFVQTYHSYINPLHIRDNGQCCESQGSAPCPTDTLCDNVFTLCVQLSGQPLPARGNIQREDCPLGFLISRTFRNNDNIMFNTSVPVIFTGDDWPGSFQLVVQVHDADTLNPDDFVDVLVVVRSLSPSSSPTPPITYNSSAGVFFLELSFALECSENLFGDFCDVFCEPTDYDTLGHYTCNSEGGRVCLQGYQDPGNNCIECTLAEGCVNGYCEEPGQCICQDGYGGELCDQNLESRERDNRMTEIVVGVLVSVTVVTVVIMVTVLVLVWKRESIFKRQSKHLMPGDNPTYMSSADLTKEQLSTPSPSHSVPSPQPPVTPINEIITGNREDTEEPIFDDETYGSSVPKQVNLDPYGNYGDKTITRAAGQTPSSLLFDDSKYAPWSPQVRTDSDDVDSDCQSEYL